MSKGINRISFIGSGNVATHLASKLFTEGFQIKNIFSKNIKRSIKLAKKTNANAIAKLNDLSPDIDLIIIAISDDAIAKVAKNLPKSIKKNVLVTHTSGSVSSVVLSKHVKHFGVFYPLQSFSLDKEMDYINIPFCIYANRKNHEQNLVKLAREISNKIHLINDQKRQNLHLAAVFANNFSNHMFTIAKSICANHKLSFELLKPLLKEGFEKMLVIGPEKAQTGPASRDDHQTVEKHMVMLQNRPEQKEIYKLITEHISLMYQGLH